MKRKLLTVLLALVAALCLCLGLTACSGGESEPKEETGEDGHTHIAEQFQVDENGHWKICTVCGEKFSVGDHRYNSDNACETCRYNLVYTKGLEYELNEDTDTYSVKGLGEATDTTNLIIPAYYEGKAVTMIRATAFHKCRGLVNITIPNSVTNIGDGAFWDCANITSITIPNSVTEIGGSAFAGCGKLTSIEIPNSVTKIGGSAFSGCSRPTDIEIPNSVTEIGQAAFYNCSELRNITIPDSVTEIGGGAFRGTAYYNDASHWDASGVLYIGNHLIEADRSISGAYTVRAGIKTIAECAFDTCRSLTSIEIPDNVIMIGCEAFDHCSGLKSITIGDGVTAIGISAFRDCSALESIIIPDSVISIGNGAFDSCIELTSVVLPDNATKIDDGAFCDCSALTSITIPDSVISIGSGVFSGTAFCNDLTNWDSDGMLYIGNHLIEAKTTISGEYTIREGTKTIAGAAFHSCWYLQAVTIPDSVISIGRSAFYWCNSLEDVYFNGTIEKWKEIDIDTWSYVNYQTTIHCTNGIVTD